MFLPQPKRIYDLKVTVKATGEVIKVVDAATAPQEAVAEIAPRSHSALSLSYGVPVAEPKRVHRLDEMREDCMYGWLGAKTKELGVPLGYGYPSMLAMAAARIAVHPQHVRDRKSTRLNSSH